MKEYEELKKLMKEQQELRVGDEEVKTASTDLQEQYDSLEKLLEPDPETKTQRMAPKVKRIVKQLGSLKPKPKLLTLEERLDGLIALDDEEFFKEIETIKSQIRNEKDEVLRKQEWEIRWEVLGNLKRAVDKELNARLKRGIESSFEQASQDYSAPEKEEGMIEKVFRLKETYLGKEQEKEHRRERLAWASPKIRKSHSPPEPILPKSPDAKVDSFKGQGIDLLKTYQEQEKVSREVPNKINAAMEQKDAPVKLEIQVQDWMELIQTVKALQKEIDALKKGTQSRQWMEDQD